MKRLECTNYYTYVKGFMIIVRCGYLLNRHIRDININNYSRPITMNVHKHVKGPLNELQNARFAPSTFVLEIEHLQTKKSEVNLFVSDEVPKVPSS